MLDKSELDEELIKEIVSVGGDYGRKIERCMKRMERISRATSYLKRRIERSKGTPLMSLRLALKLRKEFELLKRSALNYRSSLIIYREALGLLKHREVFELYNIESIEL